MYIVHIMYTCQLHNSFVIGLCFALGTYLQSFRIMFWQDRQFKFWWKSINFKPRRGRDSYVWPSSAAVSKKNRLWWQWWWWWWWWCCRSFNNKERLKTWLNLQSQEGQARVTKVVRWEDYSVWSSLLYHSSLSDHFHFILIFIIIINIFINIIIIFTIFILIVIIVIFTSWQPPNLRCLLLWLSTLAHLLALIRLKKSF